MMSRTTKTKPLWRVMCGRGGGDFVASAGFNMF